MDLADIIEKIGMDELHTIINYLFNVRFMTKDNQDNALEFIEFIYPKELQRSVGVRQIFGMLSSNYSQYLPLVCKKHSREDLAPHIELMAKIKQIANKFIIDRLLELFEKENNNEEILYELSLYYAQFGIRALDELLIFMINESLQNKHIDFPIQEFILNHLSHVVLKFAQKYYIDLDLFKNEFYSINKRLEMINVGKCLINGLIELLKDEPTAEQDAIIIKELRLYYEQFELKPLQELLILIINNLRTINTRIQITILHNLKNIMSQFATESVVDLGCEIAHLEEKLNELSV